jgi:hypothetical protein
VLGLPWTRSSAIVLYVIAVPVAAVAIGTMMLAGHSVATLVWKTAGSVTPTAGP